MEITKEQIENAKKLAKLKRCQNWEYCLVKSINESGKEQYEVSHEKPHVLSSWEYVGPWLKIN